VLAEVSGASLEGKDGAEERVSTAAKTDDFTTYSILLGGEGERSERGAYDVSERDGRGGRTTGTDPELDIRKTERRSVRYGASVFPRAKEKEESDNDHVGNGVITRVISGVRSHDDVTEDLDWNGLYAVRGRILPFVTCELAT
jgi:hypothetical protein